LDAANASFQAVEWAEDGRFDEATRAANAVDDPFYRPVTLARVAVVQAARDPGAARRVLARAKAAAAKFTGGEDRGFAQLDDAADAAEEIAIAEAAVGDVTAALRTVAGVEDEQERSKVLETVAAARSAAGDVAFTREAVAAEPAAGAKDHLRQLHVTACLRAGSLKDEASTVAAEIEDPYYRFHAFKDLALAGAAAGDAAGYDRAIAEARAAAARTDENTQWVWSLQSFLAEAQARALRPGDVWRDVRAVDDPVKRVRLMTAASRGLLARQRGEPADGVRSTQD
jgi:hypothetical protein